MGEGRGEDKASLAFFRSVEFESKHIPTVWVVCVLANPVKVEADSFV